MAKPARCLSTLALALFGFSLVLAACGGDRGRRRADDRSGSPAGTGGLPGDSAPSPDRPGQGAEVAPEDSAQSTPGGTVHLEIKRVNLPVIEGVVIQVERLSGEMHSVRPGEPVILDDPPSFEITVESAEVAMGYSDLSRLMNDHVFAYRGAPIRSLKISREIDDEDGEKKERLELKGRLAMALGLPFEIEGTPEPMPDGGLRVRTASIQALDIEVSGLLDFFGLESADLVGNLEDRGIGFEENDVILHLDRLLPPPRIKGKATSVKLLADRMEMTLGSESAGLESGPESRLDSGPESGAESRPESRPASSPGPGSVNYLFFRHGTVRLGRITMRDSDLTIADLDPADPFDFSFTEMTKQLVAGYAKLAEDGGLTAFTPDAGEIEPRR